MAKDLGGFERLARETGVESKLATIAAELYRTAMARGLGEEDHTAVVRLIEEWTNTRLRAGSGGAR